MTHPGPESSWSHIDKELSAYVARVRAETLEEAAEIAEQRPMTHAEFCIADPDAVRRNVAERIRSKIR